MHEIMVVPERLLNPEHRDFKPGLSSYAKGGKYLCEDIDITGWTVLDGYIGLMLYSGKPVRDAIFRFDAICEAATRRKGARIARVNLFRKSAGWEWVSFTTDSFRDTLSEVISLVSIETGNGHTYATSVHFDRLTLERYPDAPSEPRLRPTTYIDRLDVGAVVGTIKVRGRLHPVYWSASMGDERVDH